MLIHSRFGSGSLDRVSVALLRVLARASVVLGMIGAGGGSALAVDLLAPGDPIIAIDLDPAGPSGPSSESSYPSFEAPANVLDGVAATKYLNFGRVNSGFIVTPAAGSTTLQSFQLTTANDVPGRDPTAWALYGTNDAIVSMDNSTGGGESWTEIATGTVTLPDDRLTVGPVVSVTNATAYSSYRMVFTALKSDLATSMQVADVGFFQSTDGSGSNILASGDFIIAIDLDLTPSTPSSSSPVNEGPARAIDGSSATKYLNFGEENSGFIVTPSFGPSVVTDFVITTANDAVARDPASWALYGTNEPISSTNHSQGMGETWTLIDQGTLTLPDARLTVGPTVPVMNSAIYTSYRMVFPAVKDADAANSMQLAEIQFGGVGPPTPTATATPTATSTPTPTATSTPTSTPTPTRLSPVEIPTLSGRGLLLLGLLVGAASLALLRRRG